MKKCVVAFGTAAILCLATQGAQAAWTRTVYGSGSGSTQASAMNFATMEVKRQCAFMGGDSRFTRVNVISQQQVGKFGPWIVRVTMACTVP
jgi:hypothetical protein